MALLQILIATIVTLGLLITIHEYGHFWVARRCGVKVLRFSIGFGKAWCKWHDRHGTEFVLAVVPLGGYVKMLDEREGRVDEADLPLAFNRQSVGKRIAIVVAGPLANFLFAIVAYWLLFVMGTQVAVPVVGELAEGSPAAVQMLPQGDEIVAVDGELTRSWRDINVRLLARIGDSGKVTLTTQSLEGGTARQTDISIIDWLVDAEAPDPLGALGIGFYRPPIPVVIDFVESGSAANQAGLKSGDKVTDINGEAIADWSDFVAIVSSSPGKTLALDVERAGRSIELNAIPGVKSNSLGESIGYLGVRPAAAELPAHLQREISHSALLAWGPAVKQTWQMTVLTLGSLKKMVLGDISVKNLSGPITIAKVAGASAERGVNTFLSFLAYVSISLGIINILPIPVLDGGHLMFYLVELVKGRPVSERVQNFGMRIGLSMILMLMCLAIFNDLMRL